MAAKLKNNMMNAGLLYAVIILDITQILLCILASKYVRQDVFLYFILPVFTFVFCILLLNTRWEFSVIRKGLLLVSILLPISSLLAIGGMTLHEYIIAANDVSGYEFRYLGVYLYLTITVPVFVLFVIPKTIMFFILLRRFNNNQGFRFTPSPLPSPPEGRG